jgi:hypothetical protein
MESHFETPVYDTDAHLLDEGLQIVDPDSIDVRELMRPVEELRNAPDADLSLDEARLRLDVIDPLVDRLEKVAQGQIDPTLMEHATGTAAEAAQRVASAHYEVIRQADVWNRLKRILIFAKGSTFPPFSQQHEDDFHDHAGWGSPSARNGSAGGLMALVRAQNTTLDTDIRSAIQELARDPVCDVRLQVVQNLSNLRNNDPEWMWAEIEHVVVHEYTRQVVGSALHALAQIAYMDIPRALRTAKLVLHRYDGQQGPGIGQVCHSAASLIAGIHFSVDNEEADEFIAERLADPSASAEILTVWVARYSDNLTRGGDTGSDQDRLRAKTISFYRNCVIAVSDNLARLYAEHDLGKSSQWHSEVQSCVQALNRVLDEMALRIYFASGGDQRLRSTQGSTGSLHPFLIAWPNAEWCTRLTISSRRSRTSSQLTHPAPLG